MADAIVVGAGPVGLLAGAALSRRGLDVVILEQRTEPGGGSRAIGLHGPALAALEASGVTDRILAEAVRVRTGRAWREGRLLGSVRFDGLSLRFPFVATLPQARTEAALRDAAPPVLRGVTVESIRAESDRVRVRAGEAEFTGAVVVVATGWSGRGLVYRPGALRRRDYPDHYLMSDVAAGDPTPLAHIHLGRGGVLESFPLSEGRRRFVAYDPHPGDDAPAHRVARLQEAVAATGEDAAAANVRTADAFRIRRVLARRLQRGRVFVVGDAAHEISPIGGQGMNLGLLDAATLTPLLTAWVRSGTRPDADIARWERDRLASARTAGGLAAMNTLLGRPGGRVTTAARTAGLRAVLATPAAGLLARAYAMGFDADAR